MNIKSESERVTGIIHSVHQKVREVVTFVERVMLEHINFHLIEHMQKIEE